MLVMPVGCARTSSPHSHTLIPRSSRTDRFSLSSSPPLPFLSFPSPPPSPPPPVEVLGWSARVWSHFDLAGPGYIVRLPFPFLLRRPSLTLFISQQMQICVLVIAPTFFSAALYWAGGLIIADVASARSSRWLSAKWFKIIFITADVVALVIQGIGGGMAGSADGPGTQLENGTQCVFLSFFPFLDANRLSLCSNAASCLPESSSSSSS
jgi:hypothetical protein